MDVNVLFPHIVLLNNTRAICMTFKIVVKLPFEVEFKPLLSHSRTVGHPSKNVDNRIRVRIYCLFRKSEFATLRLRFQPDRVSA